MIRYSENCNKGKKSTIFSAFSILIQDNKNSWYGKVFPRRIIPANKWRRNDWKRPCFSPNEIMDLQNNHQWPLKLFSKKLIRSFIMNKSSWTHWSTLVSEKDSQHCVPPKWYTQEVQNITYKRYFKKEKKLTKPLDLSTNLQ